MLGSHVEQPREEKRSSGGLRRGSEFFADFCLYVYSRTSAKHSDAVADADAHQRHWSTMLRPSVLEPRQCQNGASILRADAARRSSNPDRATASRISVTGGAGNPPNYRITKDHSQVSRLLKLFLCVRIKEHGLFADILVVKHTCTVWIQGLLPADRQYNDVFDKEYILWSVIV
jgi:hypothetical protein